MSDLLTMLRENDLPPKWDGLAVLWQGWEYVQRAFLCPPPAREVCEGCGMPTMERGFPAWSANRGLLAAAAILTHDDLRYEEENRKRLGSVAHKRKARAHFSLHAFRCHSCSLDTVWDTRDDTTWTLDHTDYGNEGSRA